MCIKLLVAETIRSLYLNPCAEIQAEVEFWGVNKEERNLRWISKIWNLKKNISHTSVLRIIYLYLTSFISCILFIC